MKGNWPGSEVQVPGLQGFVQSRCWTPESSDDPAAESAGEGQLSVIAQHSGPDDDKSHWRESVYDLLHRGRNE
jgi:hypothetical protein